MPSRCNSTMEEAKTRIMCVHVRGRPDVMFVYVFSKINHIRAGSGIKGMWSRLLWRKVSKFSQTREKQDEKGRKIRGFCFGNMQIMKDYAQVQQQYIYIYIWLPESPIYIYMVAGVIDVREASTGFGRLASKLCGNISILESHVRAWISRSIFLSCNPPKARHPYKYEGLRHFVWNQPIKYESITFFGSGHP